MKFASFGALALLAITSGCVSLDASIPGTLRADLDGREVETVGQYQKEIAVSHAPFGFGKGPADAFHSDLIAAAHERGADGLMNVQFESQATFEDMCLTQVTCGILMPRHYKLKGTLVRILTPPVPGKPPNKVALPFAQNGRSVDERQRAAVAMRY